MKLIPIEANAQQWGIAYLGGGNGGKNSESPGALNFASEGPVQPLAGLSSTYPAVLPANAPTGLSGAATGILPEAMIESARNPRFSVVMEKYFTEKGESITSKTKKEIKRHVKRFIEFAGDLPIQAYDKLTHIVAFKDALVTLPGNLPRKWNNKNFNEILKAIENKHPDFEGKDKLSYKTINSKYLFSISVIFGFAERNAYINSNIISGIRVENKRVEHVGG